MRFPGSMPFRLRSLSFALLLSFLVVTIPGWAQSKDDPKPDSDSAQSRSGDQGSDQDKDQTTGTSKDSSVDPLKRPINEKQRRENSKSLKIELTKVYKKWLNEDVIYIISDEERDAFKRLSNDEERDSFI